MMRDASMVSGEMIPVKSLHRWRKREESYAGGGTKYYLILHNAVKQLFLKLLKSHYKFVSNMLYLSMHRYFFYFPLLVI